MCGICGVVSLRPPGPDAPGITEAAVVRMRDTMVHRGPDDEGVFVAPGIGLGHRRLSIIDVAGGHQPMATPDETAWITYNGEVYNFQELRDELQGRGLDFRTKSDTEVILRAWEAYGDAAVERLRGMFAFGLWDGRRRRLLLARDPLGIKPLYIAPLDGGLAFASELKAFDGLGLAAVETLAPGTLFDSEHGVRRWFRMPQGAADLEPGGAAEPIWRELRLFAEPGGAAALAAVMCGAYVPDATERVVVLVCGANGDPADVIS